MREEIAGDPFMKRCCVTGRTNGKIEWHHNLIFAGRQVNQTWAILPLSEAVHIQARHTDVKERLDWIMLNRATDEQLSEYSKAEDLITKRQKLNQKFGEWKKNWYEH